MSTTELTKSLEGQSYGRFLDAAVAVHDGAAACSVVIEEPSVPGNPGPDYVVQNTGNVDLKSCDLVFYAYDPSGKQLVRIEVRPFVYAKKSDVLHPAQAIRGLVAGPQLASVAGRTGVTWEAVVTSVTFADGFTWSDPSRAPAQKSAPP